METSLEWILTNGYKTDMISWLAAHPENFDEVIKLSLTDKHDYSWRAAWLLWSCMEKNDQRIQPYISNMIDSLACLNDNQQRELMIILHKMEISEKYEGLLFDHCYNVWEIIDKKPSVRYSAFKILVKIARKHPELYNELLFLTQHQYMDSLSAAANKSITLHLKGIRGKQNE